MALATGAVVGVVIVLVLAFRLAGVRAGDPTVHVAVRNSGQVVDLRADARITALAAADTCGRSRPLLDQVLGIRHFSGVTVVQIDRTGRASAKLRVDCRTGHVTGRSSGSG